MTPAAPSQKPHQLSFFNPADYSTSVLHCNLVSLSVTEMKAHAACNFGTSNFDLMHNGNVLVDGCKAIDVGIGNGAVVVVQVPGGAAAPPAQMKPAPVSSYMPPGLPFATPQAALAARGFAPYTAAMAMPPQFPTHPAMPQAAGNGIPPMQMPPQMMAQAAPLAFFSGQLMPQQMFGANVNSQQLAANLQLPAAAPSPSLQSPPHSQTAATDRVADACPTRGHSMPVVRSGSGSGLIADSERGSSAPLSAQEDPCPMAHDFTTCALSHDGATNLIKALRSLPNPSETVDQLLPVVSKAGFAALSNNPHSSKVLETLIDLSQRAQKAALFKLACTDSVLREFFDVAPSLPAGADILVTLMNEVGDHESVLDGQGVPLIAGAIAASISRICTSVNGRKVLLATIEKYGVRLCMRVYEQAVASLVDLCTEQSGCITVQRMYDHADAPLQAAMQQRMLECADRLIMDPYGNYVLQHAVKGNPGFSAVMAGHVKGKLAMYASNKFSSNVIEKCVQTGPDDVRKALVKEICLPQVLEKLVHDSYGNYVVQSAIDNAPGYLVDTLRNALAPLVGSSPYGYRIETKLQKRLKKGRDQQRQQHRRHQHAAAAAPPAAAAAALKAAAAPQVEAGLDEKMAMAFLKSLSSQVAPPQEPQAVPAVRDPLGSIANQRNIMNALQAQGRVVKPAGAGGTRTPLSPVAVHAPLTPTHQDQEI
eukprot:TRINITY_DN6958_c0_g2_i1.p1 TRINITY_DN6958_c0_g2~~TRINITY_DN6958_c0_g2_i1.p1  ORF type:complete len:707 (+),score=304.93 TRINITY_DN6958_c0_g2_i1:61-2181(+)